MKKVIIKKKLVKKRRKIGALPVIHSKFTKASLKQELQGQKLRLSHGYDLVKRINGLFDTSSITDLDSLKKQYFKLSKIYHPDAGGTKEQFQALNAEHEKLRAKILSGSSFTEDQKKNEVEIDDALRAAADCLINLEGLEINLIGKWIWVSGETYPVRAILKAAGFIFIKKAGQPFWVYKGAESTGRGKMEMEEIIKKYGKTKIELPKNKKIGAITRVQKTKLTGALIKLKKSINKRYI